MKSFWEWKDLLGLRWHLCRNSLPATWRMCCRNNPMDQSLPVPCRSSQEATLALTTLWGWQHHAIADKELRTWRLRSGLTQTRWHPLDTKSAPSLLLAAQMNTETQKGGPKWWTITPLLRVWWWQDLPSPCWSVLAGPDQKFLGGGGSQWGRLGPQSQIRQKPLLTPHLHSESRSWSALLSDCDCFVFEISAGLFE